VFLDYGQRLSDLLKDERAFLPLEIEEGEVKVVSKRSIMEVEILNVSKRAAAQISKVATSFSSSPAALTIFSACRLIQMTLRSGSDISNSKTRLRLKSSRRLPRTATSCSRLSN